MQCWRVRKWLPPDGLWIQLLVERGWDGGRSLLEDLGAWDAVTGRLGGLVGDLWEEVRGWRWISGDWTQNSGTDGFICKGYLHFVRTQVVHRLCANHTHLIHFILY